MTEGRFPRSLCHVLPIAGTTSQDNLKILSSNLKLGRCQSFFFCCSNEVGIPECIFHGSNRQCRLTATFPAIGGNTVQDCI